MNHLSKVAAKLLAVGGVCHAANLGLGAGPKRVLIMMSSHSQWA